MARHRQLSRAPLREALVDLQFEARLSLEQIDRFVGSLEGTYGKKVDVWETVFDLNTTDTGSEARSSRSAVGRRLESMTGPFVLQCRVSGFTLSRLSPYGAWEELQTEAQRLWSALQVQVGSFTVSRIAVRYINEIRIPLPIADFGEYLVCPPRVPDPLPQAISGFLTRVIIPDEATNCVAIVTQALEGPPADGVPGKFVTVLLDIDVFRVTQTKSGDESLWTALRTLRDQKNRMFFGHVTEKTAELYE